jgi:hypothetical protein
MPAQSSNQPTILTLEQWKGLNQQAKRGSIDDNEEWWNENLFAVGPGNLRSCWGHGPTIYTAPSGTTILRMFFGFIGYPTPQFAAPGPQYGGRLGWMFLSDGTVDQVDLDQQTVTHIGQIWEPVPPQYWASAVVWRPRFFGSVEGQVGGVLFGSPQGLYAWDGTTLSSPGDPAPDWLTDAAESAPGPVPGPFTMPVGLPGIYTMEVYQERLFVAGKDVISFSAPSNGADFSTANGGGSFGYFGNKLTYSYMDLAASAGYLYCFGDSSTDLISNITLAGSGTLTDPYVTNFNYANIDPQVGHAYPRPVGRVGRYLVMLNGVPFTGADTSQQQHRGGIYLMEGGEGIPIGNKVTTLFNSLDTSAYLPTVAAATMFGFRVVLINGQFTDPWGVERNLLLMYHPVRGQEFWSVASQNSTLTQIGNYEQDSIITPYGTDGTNLFELFAQPDNLLPKRLSSKALRGQGTDMITEKSFKRLYLEIHDESVNWESSGANVQTGPGFGVTITGTQTSGGGTVGGTQDVYFEIPPGKRYDILPYPTSGGGIWTYVDLYSLSPDFTIERLHIAAEERTLFGA